MVIKDFLLTTSFLLKLITVKDARFLHLTYEEVLLRFIVSFSSWCSTRLSREFLWLVNISRPKVTPKFDDYFESNFQIAILQMGRTFGEMCKNISNMVLVGTEI